ncbi:DCC1-like thiol-disulfide oxidoreductase family protein [Prochlorococcus sp. MIT 1300]|uniref:DCC1-like thiol-disulfide oxidoreductase family protein n=1 Tax=Prochlorococcus sp. MIT 1300 TaxID=3096218 RepID=UPI002A757F11|nr:DCC1-like thiol-disulfide oxidoreductase family protein [Prochlorococcus sp. MIT 1300]
MTLSPLFIYDGECPFCNHFAHLLELKSNIPGIKIQNARTNTDHIPNGYDIDTQGAILLVDDEIMYGSQAINWVCTKLNNPSDGLLKLLSQVFSSKSRAINLFPLLLISRRILLFLKGVPAKIST